MSVNFKRWTIESIKCYKRGCVCEGCMFNNAFESGKCKMKESVRRIVENVGRPEVSAGIMLDMYKKEVYGEQMVSNMWQNNNDK